MPALAFAEGTQPCRHRVDAAETRISVVLLCTLCYAASPPSTSLTVDLAAAKGPTPGSRVSAANPRVAVFCPKPVSAGSGAR